MTHFLSETLAGVNEIENRATEIMSSEDRSSFLLRDFEPSAVRLKRKLRLILSKTIRRDKVGEQNVTLNEFIFYLSTFRPHFHTNRDSTFDPLQLHSAPLQ